MATLGWDNVTSVDLIFILLGILFYLSLVWLPVTASTYWAKTYSEHEFKWHWWKFRRQYIYCEVMFRTHVIFMGGAFTVMLGEKYEWWIVIVVTLVFAALVALLKWISNLVKVRIPGTTQMAMILKDTIHGTKTSRGDMKQFLSQMSDTHLRTSIAIEMNESNNIHTNSNAPNISNKRKTNEQSKSNIPSISNRERPKSLSSTNRDENDAP